MLRLYSRLQGQRNGIDFYDGWFCSMFDCLCHFLSLSLSLSHAHTHMRTLFLIPPVPLCFKTRHGCDSSCHCLERNRSSDGSIRRHQWYVHILFLNCIQTSRELTPFLQCLYRFLFCSHLIFFRFKVFNWCENSHE